MPGEKAFDLPDPPPGESYGSAIIAPAAPEERAALNGAAYVSAVLACVEALAAIFTGSLALMAIAVDSAEDAAHYGLASLTSGRPRHWFIAGLALLGAFALAAYCWIGWTAFTAFTGAAPPNPWIMMGVAALSLIGNLWCVWKLRGLRYVTGELSFAWAETRWDFLADLGVIVAAMAVSDWAQRWPDTTAGLIIAAVNLVGIVRLGASAFRAARDAM
ncbi:MAG: cation transporter [Flavobacteriaceae bacterium]